LFSFGGCNKKESKAPPEKVVNVQVQPAEKRYLKPFVETIGTLNPYEEVIVSAEVDGIIKDVKVDEGSLVSKGRVLALIDDIDYDLEVKRADAALRQAEATLSNINLEYQRKEALYKEQLVTQQQFDDVSTRRSLAEAEVERAKAAFSLARQKLSKTKVYSPLSGVVKEKKTERGNYVKNGAALFTIVQNNPIKLNFTVTEKDVGKLKTGQDVLFKVDAFPDKEFKGKLNIIYPCLEENTRTLQVEAQAPNQNGLLKPGLFAHVTLYTGAERNIILVPATSLLYEGEKVKVFIVESDRAKERSVKAGQKYKLQSSVGSQSETGGQPESHEYSEITEGIKAGDLVVTVGQQNLFGNAKVNVAR
jgi:membrane fusion protein (multidrug efflux system)